METRRAAARTSQEEPRPAGAARKEQLRAGQEQQVAARSSQKQPEAAPGDNCKRGIQEQPRVIRTSQEQLAGSIQNQPGNARSKMKIL